MLKFFFFVVEQTEITDRQDKNIYVPDLSTRGHKYTQRISDALARPIPTT